MITFYNYYKIYKNSRTLSDLNIYSTTINPYTEIL